MKNRFSFFAILSPSLIVVNFILTMPQAWGQNSPPSGSPPVNSPGNPPQGASPSPGSSGGGDNQATALPPEPGKDPFEYDETVGRDPFKIPKPNFNPQGGQVAVENLDSLEGVQIPEGVKLLAIIYEPKNPRALIRKLSNGRTYTVFKKSRVGLGGGVVEEIREDEVIVVRTIDNDGEISVEPVVLKLKEKDSRKESN